MEGNEIGSLGKQIQWVSRNNEAIHELLEEEQKVGEEEGE